MFNIGKFLAFTLTSLLLVPSTFAASAEALLARDLRAAKIQFGQEQRLYHYFDIYREEDSSTQALMASPTGRRKIMQDRISYATSKFWMPASGSQGLFAGEGLYLAIDPSISESYGKMLIEFKVKPSTFYINLARGVYLQADTVKAIYDEHHLTAEPGSEVPDSMRISEMTLNTILRPENARFRVLLQKALKAENIMMAEYIWRSDLDVICGEDSPQTAFVYIGTDQNLPEFSSVEMADVKQAYPSVPLTASEKVASVEAQKLITLIRVNQEADSHTEKVQNALSIYKTEQSLQQALGTLHGCSR